MTRAEQRFAAIVRNGIIRRVYAEEPTIEGGSMERMTRAKSARWILVIIGVLWGVIFLGIKYI